MKLSIFKRNRKQGYFLFLLVKVNDDVFLYCTGLYLHFIVLSFLCLFDVFHLFSCVLNQSQF